MRLSTALIYSVKHLLNSIVVSTSVCNRSGSPGSVYNTVYMRFKRFCPKFTWFSKSSIILCELYLDLYKRSTYTRIYKAIIQKVQINHACKFWNGMLMSLKHWKGFKSSIRLNAVYIPGLQDGKAISNKYAYTPEIWSVSNNAPF